MRPLFIDDAAKAAIQALKEHAEKNVLSIDDLLDMVDGKKPKWGDLPGSFILLLVGYRVVFSMEQQKIGLCRQLSISVNTSNRIPSMDAVQMIMNEFGFEHPLEKCILRVVDNDAIYVLECVDTDVHDNIVNGKGKIGFLK